MAVHTFFVRGRSAPQSFASSECSTHVLEKPPLHSAKNPWFSLMQGPLQVSAVAAAEPTTCRSENSWFGGLRQGLLEDGALEKSLKANALQQTALTNGDWS